MLNFKNFIPTEIVPPSEQNNWEEMTYCDASLDELRDINMFPTSENPNGWHTNCEIDDLTSCELQIRRQTDQDPRNAEVVIAVQTEDEDGSISVEDIRVLMPDEHYDRGAVTRLWRRAHMELEGGFDKKVGDLLAECIKSGTNTDVLLTEISNRENGKPSDPKFMQYTVGVVVAVTDLLRTVTLGEKSETDTDLKEALERKTEEFTSKLRIKSENLIRSNRQNLEMPEIEDDEYSKGYAEGYNDALIDLLEQMDIYTSCKRCQD